MPPFGLAQQHLNTSGLRNGLTTQPAATKTCHMVATSQKESKGCNPPQNLTRNGISCIIHVYYMKDPKKWLDPQCSIMYNTHSSFVYCKGFQTSEENGSACVFLKHDLFCTAIIPCVCLSRKSNINSARASLRSGSLHCVI